MIWPPGEPPTLRGPGDFVGIRAGRPSPRTRLAFRPPWNYGQPSGVGAILADSFPDSGMDTYSMVLTPVVQPRPNGSWRLTGDTTKRHM